MYNFLAEKTETGDIKMNFQPLKDFLDGYLSMLGIPGSDTVIYRNHEEIFRYQSGYDDIETSTPVRPNAFYNIYSCTKVATAVAFTQLIERGEISINDPLYAYFPEYRDVMVKVKDDEGNVIDYRKPKAPILLKHLISMSSGINYNINSPSIQSAIRASEGRAPTLEVVSAIAGEALEFDPGEKFLYGLSHDIVGGVIELVSGMRFSEYMKENIFAPLGMNETYYRVSDDMLPRMATQYNYDEKTHKITKIPSNQVRYRFGTEYDSAGAGIVSTVSDYILLVDALSSGGVGKSKNRILSKFGVQLMATPLLTQEQLVSFPRRGYGYGYGVQVNTNPQDIGNIAPKGEFGFDGAKLSFLSASMETGISIFHAEHMGGFHNIVIPRLRNLVYSCIGE